MYRPTRVKCLRHGDARQNSGWQFAMHLSIFGLGSLTFRTLLVVRYEVVEFHILRETL